MSPGLLLALLFVVCIACHVPIGVSLGVASVGTAIVYDISTLSYAFQTLFNAANSFPLLAVPFFIFAGEVMSRGGISVRLIGFGKTLLGWVRGSFGAITVFVCGIFAAISGSAPATVAAIGSIMIPEMEEDGYNRDYACSLAAVSGGLGPLIPPSIVMVIYGITAGQSISSLFIAGLMPGIILMVLLMLVNYFTCRKYGFGQTSMTPFRLKEVWKGFKHAILSLLMPVIILGGIYGGFFTPTEAAAVASAFGIIIGVFVYKEIKFSQLSEVFIASANTLGSVTIMLGCATYFGRVLTLLGIPAEITRLLTSLTDSKIVLLLLINVILLLAGMFIETLAAVMIFTPLLLPVVTAFGIDPLHFGAIICLNLVIGMITPPVGINLFIAQAVGGARIEGMLKWIAPLFLAMIITLILVTYIPAISLFLIPGK